MRRCGALAGLVIACTAALSGSARADAPATVGWWYELQQLPSVVPVAVPAPPYVPAGDLLVEGTAAGTDAVAAVDLLLPTGRLAARLTVPVVSSRGVVSVEVCKTLSGFAPATAGNWDDRPVCDGASIVMTASKDGKSLSADVSTLAKEGVVDVLLEPATNPTTGSETATSVTLGVPTSADLTTTAAPQAVAPVTAPLPAQPPVGAAPEGTSPAVAPILPAQPPVSAPIAPGALAPSEAPSGAPSQAPLVAPAQAAPTTAPLAATPVAKVDKTQGRLAALLLLLLTALVSALLLRGRRTPEDGTRGVGRYRSARAGAPTVRL